MPARNDAESNDGKPNDGKPNDGQPAGAAPIEADASCCTPLCCAPILSAVLDDEGAERLANLLKALADPVRLRLVSYIAASAGGEVCACDLPQLLGRSQPTISHHLTLLTKAGILDRTQRGKWAWFRLHPEQLAALGRILAPVVA